MIVLRSFCGDAGANARRPPRRGRYPTELNLYQTTLMKWRDTITGVRKSSNECLWTGVRSQTAGGRSRKQDDSPPSGHCRLPTAPASCLWLERGRLRVLEDGVFGL